ncbi:MAG: DUF4827 domain-containing protein [Prevotella sp.]|nr:DUF4827 domain-containing protein [Prevotella sp.]
MKKLVYILILVVTVLASCNDYETYGDKKEKERNAISKFISDSSIVVISEDQFIQQGQTTNVARNEYVKLDKTGVYMQIVRPGCGSMILDGQKTNLVCRFSEYNLLADSVQARNNTAYYASSPDIMYVSRSGSTYTAAFLSGVMYNAYSASVPAGWLVPLSYVKVGRPQSEDEECAKVKLIVPHTQGHAVASSNVVPYYYELILQKEK